MKRKLENTPASLFHGLLGERDAEQYARERREAAQRVLNAADRMERTYREAGKAAIELRDAIYEAEAVGVQSSYAIVPTILFYVQPSGKEEPTANRWRAQVAGMLARYERAAAGNSEPEITRWFPF